MIKHLLLLGAFSSIIACTQTPGSQVKNDLPGPLYSRAVADSFFISVNLPPGYNTAQQQGYPVVYLLDANLYFDIVAAAINRYADVGLVPPVILVGIGYRDFPTMDSLRNRDYTYPVAIPEYEMSVSGGAGKFLAFINTELAPLVDARYNTDTAKRVLMGHSLGGYFTMYALLQLLQGRQAKFSHFIAASPSLHYNNYYLLHRLNETPQGKTLPNAKAYLAFGGEEDGEDTTMMRLPDLYGKLRGALVNKQGRQVIYKGDIYSDLGHMDTQLPAFIKGMRWVLDEDR